MFRFFFNKIAAIILLLSVFFVACKDDDDTSEADYNLQLQWQALINNKPLNFTDEFETVYGEHLKFSLFQFYLSNIALINNNNEAVALKDVILYDLSSPDTLRLKVPAGEYKAVRFGLGLDAATNASDPATFAIDHPLSVSQNTHWGWATKYKFVQLEGRSDYDTTQAVPRYAFSYHTGTDALYRVVELEKDLQLNNSTTKNVTIQFDANRLLYNSNDTIYLREQTFTHSETPEQLELATEITDNFTQAFLK